MRAVEEMIAVVTLTGNDASCNNGNNRSGNNGGGDEGDGGNGDSNGVSHRDGNSNGSNNNSNNGSGGSNKDNSSNSVGEGHIQQSTERGSRVGVHIVIVDVIVAIFVATTICVVPILVDCCFPPLLLLPLLSLLPCC
jgi:hypothetical protein